MTTRPDAEGASRALADLLVAQWAAGRVPGVNPFRNRFVPVPYDDGAQVSFSPSQLETYKNCPRKYLYAALLKLDQEEKGPALVLGSTVHKVLEVINHTRLETGEIVPDDEVNRLVDEHWPLVGFEITVQSDQLRNRAKAMIRRYLSYERGLGQERKPVWIEQYNRVPYEQHEVRGKVDVVMRNADGSVDILDFKTGSTLPAHTKSMQLFLYAHMWLTLEGMADEVQSGFVGLRQKEDKGFRVGAEWNGKDQIKSNAVTDKWLATCSDEIDEVLNGIAANAFPTNPSDKCPSCMFRKICPDG